MSATKDLAQLEASGLVSVASLQPELEYMFRHALLQDAAYDSLLKQERRDLHRRVAQTLDGLYPGRRDELAGIVAMHLEEAGDADAAAERYVLAGAHALARFAKVEARGFFDRAVALIAASDTRAPMRILRARATVGSARAGVTMVPSRPDAERLAGILADAEASGDTRLIADAHFWHAFLRRELGENPSTSPELRRSLERARELAERGGDPLGMALAEAWLGAGAVLTSHYREGAAVLEKQMPVIQERGDPLTAGLLNDILAIAYARLGDFAAADRTAELAERLAANGDPIARLDALIARANIAAERGEVLPAIALATTCARDADALGAPACGVGANLVLGGSHLSLDDAASARAPLEHGYQLALTTGLLPLRNITEGLLHATAVRMGERSEPAEWDATLAATRAIGDRHGEAMILSERATARMSSTGTVDEAGLADLAAAARLYEEIEARPALSRTLRMQARAFALAGRAREADEARARATTIEAELGITRLDM